MKLNSRKLFPELIFFDDPISDDDIIGIALVLDESPTWVVAYDGDKTLMTIANSFFKNEKMALEDAIFDAWEWYENNTLGSYLGADTPVFINKLNNTANRFQYDLNIINFNECDTLYQAMERINANTLFYVPLQ
jgi:hypothetical protein